MKLSVQDLVRIGATGIQPCYAPSFIEEPELVASPASSALTIIRGQIDGQVRPYGTAYIDQTLGAWVVNFRGTETASEWWRDLQALLVDCPFLAGARIHHGFALLYSTLEAGGSPLPVFLRTLSAAKDLPIIIAGHSLGAALATLAAADLGCGANLVTFASPRCGDDRFAEMAMSRLGGNYRIRNVRDLVTDVPLREPLFPYSHLGVAMEYDSGSQTVDNPHAWHSLETYLHLLDPAQPILPEFLPAA